MESYAVSSEPVQKRIHNHNLTKFYYDFIASKVILEGVQKKSAQTFYFIPQK